MNKLISTLCFFLACFAASAQNGNSALHVDGRFLIDSCGEAIILRGVNHGNVWQADFGFGIPQFSDIAQTGANSVRIVLERTYETWASGSSVFEDLSGEQIDTIIQAALYQGLIPIVELHDFTDGSGTYADVQTNLDNANLFWRRPDVMAALKKHSRFLILNLANEPEHDSNTDQHYYDACVSAIEGIRADGLKVPIMIDGKFWGQDYQFFLNNGANLLTADPEHSLLFSLHTYWSISAVPDPDMNNRFSEIFTSNLPFVIGEFAHTLRCPPEPPDPINYPLIMGLCQSHSIGYLYWWWGSVNPDPDANNCLSMSPDGSYANLAGEGYEVAISDVNSIQGTSVRPYLLVNGNCVTGIEEQNNSSEFSVSPNPSDGTFFINTTYKPVNIKLADVLGNEVLLTQTGATSFSTTSASAGIYFVTVYTSDGKQSTKKLIIQ